MNLRLFVFHTQHGHYYNGNGEWEIEMKKKEIFYTFSTHFQHSAFSTLLIFRTLHFPHSHFPHSSFSALPHFPHSAFSTLLIFHTLHFLHASFSTLRIFDTQHFDKTSLREILLTISARPAQCSSLCSCRSHLLLANSNVPDVLEFCRAREWHIHISTDLVI